MEGSESNYGCIRYHNATGAISGLKQFKMVKLLIECVRNDKNNKVIKRQNLYKMKRDEAVGVRCMFRRKKDKIRTYFDAHTSYGS